MPAQQSNLPLVSVGLPVFNGEVFLDRAIRSILNQSFQDLELVICDNASTDSTQRICEEFASRDPRVRYYRNPKNLGAGPNYDLCFHRSRGKYFKWMAHDDMLALDYLELSVKALERDPDAVLCTVGIQEIGPNDEWIRSYANTFPDADARSAAKRFGCLIHTRHQCEDFFSLYRRQALVGSGLHDSYSGSDRVLLAEMALRGPWAKVSAPLFLHREHNLRYTRAVLLVDRAQAALWQDTSKPAKKNTMYHWGVYRRYWGLVGKNALSPTERLACAGQLLRWWFTDGHATDVVRDLLRTISPDLLNQVRAAKRTMLRWGGARHSAPPPGSLPSLD